MTRRLYRLIGSGTLAALALALDAAALPAQADSWRRLVAGSDSVGPETPSMTPGGDTACGPGVETPDSVRVSAGSGEFLLARYSLRTRGYFTYPKPPARGAERFAVRRILCDRERGHPRTFVLERDHRYFYLVFSLRSRPTYRALAFPADRGGWGPFRWDAVRRTFTAAPPDPRPSSFP